MGPGGACQPAKGFKHEGKACVVYSSVLLGVLLAKLRRSLLLRLCACSVVSAEQHKHPFLQARIWVPPEGARMFGRVEDPHSNDLRGPSIVVGGL